MEPALDSVKQSDELPVVDDSQRPQFHFTSRVGWLNDPNGMVWSQGEWHLYYQHNPYGWAWGNMHWGHAVSKDLLHWEELPISIYPHKFGDWAFSGSAVVDAANTSGWKSGDGDLLVGAYTSTGRGECIVYSNDRGRTWTEYDGNPVVKHQGRDPRLLWHAASKQWVMAVYHEEGKTQSIMFHTSPDLKAWTQRGKIDGFYECPDLFELPVDGDAAKSRWVLLAADGKYLLGSFDGAEFKPDGAKQTLWHGAFYAAQTFSNAPGGRRIQVGWARGTDFPGAAFNQQMNVPVELELKTTAGGVRMTATPVKEIEQLRGKKHEWKGELKPGENPLSGFQAELVDAEVAVQLHGGERLTLDLRGVSLTYDATKAQLRCRGIAFPAQAVDGRLRLRALLDRGSLEVFVNGGESAACIPVFPSAQNKTFNLTATGQGVEVESAALRELRADGR
jgi:fructan beta-fructosidase